MSEVSLREIGPADADALSALFVRNDHPDVTATFDPFPLDDATARRIAGNQRRDRYYAAVLDGELVGLTMLRGWDEGYDVPSFGTFVDRSHQGRGIGTQILDLTLDAARALGCERVRLSVYASNPGARRLYASRGFVELERSPVVREGRADERIVMVKELRRIPVAAPALVGREREYVVDCVDSTWISSSGRYIERFESAFAGVCDVAHGVACCNGTVALHVALTALGVEPGDEVIVPTLTYVASANAVRYRGAEPVFVDSDPTSWNLDPERVADAITARTKGIMVVHLYGHPADMDPISALAREHGLWVLEDAAEAHGATYKGRAVGSLGDVAAFSFYGNKVITTGEGGMVVCEDDELAAHVRQLRGQGQDPQRRYWFPIVGFNYRMTNVAAAIGLAQAERLDWHLAARRDNARWYRERLGDHPALTLSPELKWAHSSHWMACVVLGDEIAASRDEVMAALAERGVDTRPFFYPMHTLPPYADAASGRAFPVADRLAARGINLPSGATLTEGDVGYVCDALLDVLG